MSDKKKIVHIITGLNNGGAEGVLTRLCLNEKTHDHSVISLMGPGKYGKVLEDNNIDVYYLNSARGVFSIFSFFKLIKLIRFIDPNLVQTWMYHSDLLGGISCWLLGIKDVFWGVRHSNLSPEVNSKKTLLIIRFCALMSKKLPKKIIFCADESVINHNKFGYKGDTVVVKNGYEVTKFKPSVRSRALIRNELGIDDEFLFGFVARWDPQKDHRNLILALSELSKNISSFKCVLIGNGCDSKNSALLSLIEDKCLSGKILLLGERDDIPNIMNALDVHVLSSSGEAFPNVIAEAMSSGTPCITTDVGDASDIVGDTGWVVPRHDYISLSEAMYSSFLEKNSDHTHWKERQESARNRIVNEFSLSLMVNSFLNAWD